MALYNNTPVLSKIKIGTDTYWLKDSDARHLIDNITEDGYESISQGVIEAKEYADEKIGDIILIKYEVVTTLPTADAEHEFNKSKTIYMMLDSSATGSDVYDEYICINKGTTSTPSYAWEKIGSTRIDLSNYYTKSETYNKTEVDDLLDTKSTVSVSATGTATDAVKYITIDNVEKRLAAYDPDGTSIELSDGVYQIKGVNNAENNQVLAYDSTSAAVKWVNVSAIIPGAVVPVTDGETIAVAQDPTDPDKYIISLIGKANAGDKSVLRKHINGSTVTYTWDEVYSSGEVDSLLDDKANISDFVSQNVVSAGITLSVDSTDTEMLVVTDVTATTVKVLPNNN